MRHQKMMTWVSISGTALSVFLVMAFFMTDGIKSAEVAPASNRHCILTGKSLSVEIDGNPMVLSPGLSSNLANDLYSGLDGVERISYVKSWEQMADVSVKGGKLLSLQPRHVDDQFWKIYDFSFIDGRPFDKAEAADGAKVVVLSRSAARRLFNDVEVAGREVKIGYDDYRVVGVVEDASPLLTEIFANLFLPFAPRSNNYSTYEGVSTVRMLLAQGADVDKIKGEVARRMKSITAANGDKEEMKLRYGGQPYTLYETNNSNAHNFMEGKPDSHRRNMLMYYSVFILLPAVTLGSMTHSRMLRRISEIGVRRAYGAKRSSIIMQLLWENFLITLAGGLIGLLVCVLFMLLLSSYFITMIDYSYMSALEDVYSRPTFSMLFQWENFAVAVLVCLVLNILCAFIPAWRASRVEPAIAISRSRDI